MYIPMKSRLELTGIRLGKYWHRLTAPHPSIQEAGSRRQAQLSAAFTLVLVIIYLLGLIGTLAASGKIDSSTYLLEGLAVSAFVAYAFSRTEEYFISMVINVAAISAFFYADVIWFHAEPYDAFLVSIPLAFIVALSVFTWVQLAIFTTVNLILTLCLPALSSGMSMANAGTLAGQILALGFLSILVAQARKAIENARIAEIRMINDQLQELSSSLEDRIVERTRDIALAAEVTRRIPFLQDLGKLLTEACELICLRFDLYYAQVYLVDATGHSLVLSAGTGKIGEELLRRGHRLALDVSSLNGTAAIERRAVIVRNTSASSTFRPNELLPETRSEMCVPLISGERVLGVLDLQSSRPTSLSEENMPAFEILAGQLATAITNAELFAQVERSLAEAESRARRAVREGWDEYLDALEHKEFIGFAYDREAITLLTEPLAQTKEDCVMITPIEIIGEPVGAFRFSADRPWNAQETELVESVASQVAQQIENLRLLNQAENFRRAADEAVRRLTREEWQSYLSEEENGEVAFAYAGGQVQPLLNGKDGQSEVVNFDIQVQDEPVGQFALSGLGDLSTDDVELITTITEQLGAHLENMRLYTTARKELEERQQAEKALAEAMAAARMANWEYEVETGAFLFNDAYYKFLGASAEEMGGYRMSTWDFTDKFVHPDDAHVISIHLQLALQTANSDSPEEFEFRLRSLDGSYRTVIGTLRAETDEQGQVVRFFGSNQDITERKQAQETIAKRAAELAKVAQVSTAVSTIQNPDEMLQTAVDLTKQEFDLYHAHVYLLDEAGDTLTLTKGAGEVGRQMVAEGRQISLKAEKSLVARAARTRMGVIANDVQQEPDFLPHPLLQGMRSEAAVPMIAGDRLLGVIDVQDDHVKRFTEEDINIFTTLAAQVAVSLQNARQYAHAQRQAEREALINAISERIQSTNSVESALQVAVREIGRALGAQHTAIRLGLERKSNGH